MPVSKKEPISHSRERRLSRNEAADYLTSLGYKTAPKTLAKLACIGGGPVFVKFGNKPLYLPADLLDWVDGRTTPALRSTSDGRQHGK